MVFYEPFYFEFERLVDEPLFSKRRNALADCNGAPCVVRSFKPRLVDIYSNCLIFSPQCSNIEYRLDLHEDSEGNLVTATFEFPGFSKDEIQLDFQNGQLTVSAEAKKSNEKYADGYILRERPYGKFSRTIQLPQGVQVCRPFQICLNECWLTCFIGRTDQSGHGKWPIDSLVPQELAWARTKEDCNLRCIEKVIIYDSTLIYELCFFFGSYACNINNLYIYCVS